MQCRLNPQGGTGTIKSVIKDGASQVDDSAAADDRETTDEQGEPLQRLFGLGF